MKSFSELHDYVDANCYGGSEALLDELAAAAPVSNEEQTNALNKLCGLMNPAIEIVNEWLAAGDAVSASIRSAVDFQMESNDQTVIPRLTDKIANAANVAAIDRLVTPGKYKYIVAFGKWLGFTPQTVQKTVDFALTENAPEDAIQKVDGQWRRIGDITSDINRMRVEELAASAPTPIRQSFER